MNQDDELNPYLTSDTPLAAYLHFKGMVALATRDDPNDHKREVYVFIDQPERLVYEQEWRDDRDGVRSYYASLKTVKHMLRGRKR